MPHLINVPIEGLTERYSAQWNKWFPEEFDRLDINFTTVYPKSQSEEQGRIKVGEFLDVYDTLEFKALQMAKLISMLREGQIKSGDIIFFHDLWFPGLEALFYARQGAGVDFKIAGILHAGTYDSHDWTNQKGMERWAYGIERSWISEVDFIFVATEFHKQLICKLRMATGYAGYDRVKVTGLPIWPPGFRLPFPAKENIVVFPHRLAPEKQPEVFKRAAEELGPWLPSWRFLLTKEECSTKEEYYRLLGRSKVAVSCALQETFGIAQQEAVMSGCIPVVPDRLAYRELYPFRFRYGESPKALTEAISDACRRYDELIEGDFVWLNNSLQESGREAIQNMLRHLSLCR